MKAFRHLPRPGLAFGIVAVAATGLAGCSDTDRSAERFCGEIAQQVPFLEGPFVEPGDIDDLVDRYEKLDRITPLAIEDEWRTITELMKMASDVDPSDPRSRQDVADAAYKAERSARDVAIWVETTCGVAMPDVVGVEGSVPVTTQPVTTQPAAPAP
ncbi:MAG: hypothetical protein ACKO36_08115 [Actinomycetota bacterium]|nr:hypothetical protein [Actinomycetota bacterium]